MAYREKVTIVRADEIATDIYEMCFSTKNIAKEAKPGQFVSVYSNDGSRLLPRPISICGIEGDTLRIVYRAIGKGTQEFATMHAGQTLEVQGPLGNGYDISKVSKERKAILFGGGQQKGMRSGTENVPAIAGLGVACEEIYRNYDANYAHLREVKEAFLKGIATIEGTHMAVWERIRHRTLSVSALRRSIRVRHFYMP